MVDKDKNPIDDLKQKPEEKASEINVQHEHNYIGGTFAYKNSNKKGEVFNPEDFRESVMMVGYGRARPVRIAFPSEDARAGVNPQHNSPDDFRDTIELIESKTLDAYQPLASVVNLEKLGFEQKTVSMTKDMLNGIAAQFSHLSQFAFNQMMNIPTPDKRDFVIYCKKVAKNHQVIVAYPHLKTGVTIFVQVVQYDSVWQEVLGIKHCSFDAGKPLVVNETLVDKYGNVRQMAHMGEKSGSPAFNSAERFDDGTVVWTITKEGQTGAAALGVEGEIVLVEQKLNDASKLAAMNLGAEAVDGSGAWTGFFDMDAFGAECHPKQKEFKDKIRKQIGQIIDGSTIPGLVPIFRVSGLC